jgi:hypothetical protein
VGALTDNVVGEMTPERRQLLLLLSIDDKLSALEKTMTDATDALADLQASQALIVTAVGDASAAIKDLAAKLTGQSSINPGDVEAVAASLKGVAAGLEAVVTAANEPVTEPVVAPPVVAPPVVEPQPQPDPPLTTA